MQRISITLLCLAGLARLLPAAWYDDQWADPEAKKKNLHSGNLVQTTFYNTGLVGRVGPEFSFEWPKGTGDEYIGDISICVGVEYFNKYLNLPIRSVAVTQSPARGRDEVNPANPAEYWTFMPLPGFANPESTLVAMSHQGISWPDVWPDKGWPGSWNGYFGRDVMNADQESYFWMDDSRDMEFMRSDPAYRDSLNRCTWRSWFPTRSLVFDAGSEVLVRVLDATANRLGNNGALLYHSFDLPVSGGSTNPLNADFSKIVFSTVGDYHVFPAGTRDLVLYDGLLTANAEDEYTRLFTSEDLQFDAGGRYTVVVHGTIEENDELPLQVVILQDQPAGDSIRLRLLNLDHVDRSVRLFVDSEELIGGTSRFGASDYFNLSPGTYLFTIVDSDGVTLQNQRVCLPEQPGTYSLTWLYAQTGANSSAQPFIRLFGEDPEDIYRQFVRLIQPFASDSTKGGLGLKVAVRGFQWSHSLAEDVTFWLYDITNTSDIDYDKVDFGMVCGTLVGGDGDSGDDINWFDRNLEFTYTFDGDDNGASGWVPVHPGVRDVGIVGYAFLESPGNRSDWIDNDGDSKMGVDAPRLTEQLLASWLDSPTTLLTGDHVIMVNYNDPTYPRTVVEVPAFGDTLVNTWRNTEILLFTGQDVLEDPTNLIDDNFNGLIDESRAYLDAAYVDWTQIVSASHLGLVDPELVQFWDLLIDERRDDGLDNDGDWNAEFDDVGGDGQPVTGDRGESDGLPTAGEPHFDALDITESDQLGLTSFNEFTFPEFSSRNDEDIWARMVPGEFDSVEVQPADHDFLYGSGYFPLRSGETQRISLAVVFGESEDDIFNNLATVRTIYNENYNFIQPPSKPQMQAVAGDHRVTLYWDDRAERSVDRISHLRDFEGYRIYRATDPGFLDAYSITDARGNAASFNPVAQFDLVNEVAGFFPIALNGTQYYLGDNSGLVHAWTDTTAVNGQAYFYAVTAYDSGDPVLGFLPAEAAKQASVDAAGRVTLDINTTRVTPSAPAAGYQPGLVMDAAEHLSGSATGDVTPYIVDETRLVDGARYEVSILPDTTARIRDVLGWEYTSWVADTFFTWDDDSSHFVAHIDSVGYDSTRVLLDEVRVQAFAWSMRREGMDPVLESFPINTDTPQQMLGHAGVDPDFFSARRLDRGDTLFIRTRLDTGELLDPAGAFDMDFDAGRVIYVPAFLDTLQAGQLIEVLFYYRHDLVHKQLVPNLAGYVMQVQTYDPVVEGLRLTFRNDWRLEADPELTGWENPPANMLPWSMKPVNMLDRSLGYDREFAGTAVPRDYQMEFVDGPVGAIGLDSGQFPDQSMGTLLPRIVSDLQTNYRIWDITDPDNPQPVSFWVYNPNLNQGPPPFGRNGTDPFEYRDFILLADDDPTNPGHLRVTWAFGVSFEIPINDIDNYTLPAAGDRFHAITKKPFRADDSFAVEVAAPGWTVAGAGSDLRRVRVVPNPYLATAAWEPRPIKGNRGERKIQFTHLPPTATVRVYTVRGELVQTLHHDAPAWDGSLDWNLKSSEGLDVAYGMYFYHVDSPAGEKTGKFALIK